MTHQVQMVLGTKPYLKQIIHQHPQSMLLLEGLVRQQNYALLDYEGTVPFVAPMRGTVLAQRGELQDHGFMHFMYFKLTKDDAPILAAQAKHLVEQSDRLVGNVGMWLMRTDNKFIEYVLMSAWERKLDVFAAKGTPLFEGVTPFIEIASHGLGYHEAAYQVVDPDAPEPKKAQTSTKPMTLLDLFKSRS